MRLKRIKLFDAKHLPIIVVLCIIDLIFICFFSLSGIISFLYTSFCFGFLNCFCEREKRTTNCIYFLVYILLALIYMTFNYIQMPEYMGLSGPSDVGTDDVNYYAGLADAPITYSTERWDIAEENTYSKLIRFLYPFKIIHPVDIIIFNILGIAFLPYLTNNISYVFFEDKRVSSISEKLVFYCPFLWSIGLIIMRDVISTSLIMVAYYCFLRKKYVSFILFAAVLAYLKLGFVVFLIVPIIIYYISEFVYSWRRFFNSQADRTRVLKVIVLSFFVVFALVFYIIPNLDSITQGRLDGGSFFRTTFIDYLNDANDDSFLVKIYDLPIFIRLPALIVTFIVIPPLTMNFYIDGVFELRIFLQNVVAPVFWCFVFYYLFQFFLTYKFLASKGKVLFWIIILLALALGMVSLQTRHKAVLIPYLYMAIAYSMKYNKGKANIMSGIVIFLFVIIQFAFGFLR